MSSNETKYNFLGMSSGGGNESAFGVRVVQSDQLEFLGVIQVVDFGDCSLLPDYVYFSLSGLISSF